jgi:putative chitinase
MITTPLAAARAVAPADITPDRLQVFAQACSHLLIAPHLDAAAKAHGITTPRQVRHWLANLHNESGGFMIAQENLHYSAPELVSTWPAHFPTLASARSYGDDPCKIACKVYGGRMGNVQPLDGYTYRGRGYLQLTGREAYADAGKRLGQPYEAQPDLVAQPAGAALTAADFWARHGCNAVLAAHADDQQAAIAIRTIVNGGEIGIENVLHQLARAGAIWRG